MFYKIRLERIFVFTEFVSCSKVLIRLFYEEDYIAAVLLFAVLPGAVPH